MIKIRSQPGELAFLVGERALRFAQRSGLGRKVVLGGMQLILERLLVRFEREDGRSLLAELDLEPVDGIGLFAELGKLTRCLGLQLLDAGFQPARRHRKLGAQLILVGLDFGHRQRNRRLEPAHRQADRPAVHERHRH